MKDATIVLFGDSYTAGRIPHTQTDGAFGKALYVPAYCDFAKSGSTAQQWAADCNDWLSSVVSSSADIAVGSLGGNDAFAAMSDGIVTDAEKVAALSSLFHVLMRLRRKRVILMLYPDPFCGARPDAAAGHRQLIAAIRAVADLANSINENITLLDLSHVLRPEHFDGVDIHPNEAGYRAMAEAVMGVIAGL